MPLEPSRNLKYEVRQVSAQIAKAPSFAAPATPSSNEVFVEGHKIIQELNPPRPSGVASTRNSV
jgi:hypothetical protein